MAAPGTQPATGHETMQRCDWANANPLATAYHDAEWGVPVHDDRTLFEFLTLEGAQAGLSWDTILRKRSGYARAFDGFDPRRIAGYSAHHVERLMHNPDIVRNRLKIGATIENARRFLEIQREFGSFDAYLWSFVDGRPRINAWQRSTDVPARTRESAALSKDLRRRGFRFVGETICYAYMQAIGMVNDHLVTCFRYREVLAEYDPRR